MKDRAMYHPTTRVLTVLELLQTHGKIGSGELARRLEVTPRTVRRYITMLQDLGIPIESQPGLHGGYRLRPGYKLPPLMFTNNEALAVVLGLMVSEQLGLRSANAATEGTLAKLERVLPESVRDQVRSVQEALVMDDTPATESVDSDIVVTLGRAVRELRRVWIRYNGPADATARAIDPYGLVYRHGLWYAVGWCHLRTGLRTFRLDRIEKIRLLSVGFEVPQGFNPREYALRALESRAAEWQVHVRLHTTMDEARKHVPVIMGTLHQSVDSVLLVCNTDSLEWMSYYLLEFPYQVDVLQPPELMKMINRISERASSINYAPEPDSLRQASAND